MKAAVLPDEQEAQSEAPVKGPPRRWLKITLTIVLTLSFAGLLAFGLTRDPRTLPSALAGRRAPTFSLEDMDTGETVSLNDLSGQIVVLNFWASWCVACRQEHPNFVAAWDRYRNRGVVFLGVLFQDTPENGRAYMEELGGGWPTLLDPGSRTAIDYGVYGVPETFFIGRDGVVRHKQVGATSYDLLVNWLERLTSNQTEEG
ncbi:MAG: TlpA family protein disulfide reductase [bacterium]